LSESTVLTALAAFERTIVAKESRFDRFQQGEKSALTEEEQRGFATFSGKALCSRCHKGTELSDQKFHNTGVETDDLGRIKIVRNPEFQLRPYPFFANHKAFKTPSLRNVSITAPYFHNGSEASLEDVVRFYNGGGKAVDTYGRSPDVGQLGLTESEISELVAFLGSLRSEVQFCPPSRAATNAIPANAEP
jgi:cytochrome c peroxidase